VFRITALAQEETQITEQSVPEEEETNKERQPKNEEELPPRRTKLYVGNLPRSCDIAQLTQLFQEFGTVESVEVLLIFITVWTHIHKNIYGFRLVLFTFLKGV
jgi:RNA recognition motif-containing protein